MKIRHKQSGVELEGKFAEFSQGSIYGKPRNFWIEPSNAASQYSCDQWEAVPEWVNVTGECRIQELAGMADTEELIYHNNRWVGYKPNGYRLRKVQVSIDGFPKWAFIVERKA